MAKDNQGERKATLSDLTAAGRQRVEDFTAAQAQMLDLLQESNRRWMDRMQLEANLASEFTAKLSAVRSIPDAMSVCQEWTTRHFEMMADDGKQLLADTQKFMGMAARFMPNGGWLADRQGPST